VLGEKRGFLGEQCALSLMVLLLVMTKIGEHMGMELRVAVLKPSGAQLPSIPSEKSNEEPNLYLHQSETTGGNVGVASVLRFVGELACPMRQGLYS
jgi:hypothetical protein